MILEIIHTWGLQKDGWNRFIDDGFILRTAIHMIHECYVQVHANIWQRHTIHWVGLATLSFAGCQGILGACFPSSSNAAPELKPSENNKNSNNYNNDKTKQKRKKHVRLEENASRV